MMMSAITCMICVIIPVLIPLDPMSVFAEMVFILLKIKEHVLVSNIYTEI